MTDAILMGCFLAALYFNKLMYPAVLSYAITCLYISTLFDSHSAVINHVIYGLIFIPPCFVATMRLSAAMLWYSTFHLVVAIDYFIYPETVTLISYLYNYMQIALAISLIYVGFEASHDSTNSLRNRGYSFSGVGDIWHFQTHKKTENKTR